MATRIDTTFPSGGEQCAVYVYRPDTAGGDLPVVVMAHGFSATRDDRLPAYAERFADAGMVVVLFDYRHFGASTGEPRQLLDIKKQHEDYEAAIAFARGLDGVDADRLALWGSSFSGGHVMALAQKHGRISAIVAQAPFTDGLAALRAASPKNVARASAEGLIDQAGALMGRAPHMMPVVGPEGSFALLTSAEAEPGFRAIAPEHSRWRNEVAARIMLHVGLYRPGAGAAKIPCPVLICACDQDQTTPPAPAIAVAERAPRGELKRYDIGHFDIYLGEDFERAIADQTEFLARHLGVAAQGAAGEAAEAEHAESL
ncbi:alpha/beta hydrolase [Paraconexibacter sp.]|uniref:alpha/beta hydrolase n=1 Tax=Paraconexibacter sp. TaxID=2949640 RepID=UPI0035663C40